MSFNSRNEGFVMHYGDGWQYPSGPAFPRVLAMRPGLISEPPLALHPLLAAFS